MVELRNISSQDALRIILSNIHLLEPKDLPLDKANGLVLAQSIVGQEPIPLFDNSAMDGFALKADAVKEASSDHPVRLRLLGDLAAGKVSSLKVEGDTCLRIMTGAPLPEGADSVLKKEDAILERDWVIVSQPLSKGSNVRYAGEDIKEGEQVISPETPLSPVEIGILAALGYAEVSVFPRPKVAIITTGSELIPVEEKPRPGLIRDINSHLMRAQIESIGGIPLVWERVPDEYEPTRQAIEQALREADLVITNGGISVGEYDFVKEVLKDLQAESLFWQVRQKPGKPLAFWLYQGKPVFGIPGNPVSAYICIEEYVRPALRKMMGFKRLFRPQKEVLMGEDYSKRDKRMEFLRVELREEIGTIYAYASGPQGSAILTSMAKADALVIIPEEVEKIHKGQSVLAHLIHLPEDH